MIYLFIFAAISYLIGSIPTAYIFGKLLKGIDIREHGSGNVGATNVARTLGKTYGIIVLVIDFLKGTFCVTVLPFILQKVVPGLTDTYASAIIFFGAAAIAGHIWTIFLKFKGGKGVATTGGVMAGLAPGILLGGLIVWGIAFAVWKYVSLASILAACSLPIIAVILGKPTDFVVFCSVLCLVGAYSHRSNIRRLIQGKENKKLR